MQPEELRGPNFQLPTAQSADQWLSSVKQQVVNQYKAIQLDPSKNGFTAAFTAPMLITGGAKLFTIYASKETFNGEIILRFSTDGKILIVGKLNFAADNLSISGRLYADLSKTNPDFKKLYDSMRKFQTESNPWYQASEYSYDSVMLRNVKG